MVATRKRARPAGSCSLDESTLASLNTSRAPLELTGGHAQPARMVQYFREAKLTDVTIIVDGKSYAAHRNVLAAASDYLDKLFAGPKWADQEQPVKLSQVPGAHTFSHMMPLHRRVRVQLAPSRGAESAMVSIIGEADGLAEL